MGAEKATKATDDFEKRVCFTPEFRVSFPNLFEARAFAPKGQKGGEKGEKKFDVQMIFPDDTDFNIGLKNKKTGKAMRSMNRAVQNAIASEFGDDKSKWPKKYTSPFRDGNEEKPNNPEYKDSIFCKAWSKETNKPGVIDAYRKEITDPKDFYAGCYARARIVAFWYNFGANKGVAFILLGIQKTRDGEPLTGKRSAAEDFDEIEEVELPEDDESSYEEESDSEDEDGGF